MPIIVKLTPRPDSKDPFSTKVRGTIYLYSYIYREAIVDLKSISVYD
jgi:hypothetical protein